MTLGGVPLWQGWQFKPSAKLQTKPLCLAVASVFSNQPDQNVSFITTGPFSVSSVCDGDYIVAVVCSSNCHEAELLMKAKELAHNVKTLFGTEQVVCGTSACPRWVACFSQQHSCMPVVPCAPHARRSPNLAGRARMTLHR